MKLPHFHRFSPRVRWRSAWGATGYCRCGLAKRRMFGGYGFAHVGQRWYDRPEPTREEGS